jgi:hypothetical protein
MVTLVDLVSLIMVFFVLLIAMSTIERDSWMELAGNLSPQVTVGSKGGANPESNNANLSRSAVLDRSRLEYYRSMVSERFRGTPFERDLRLSVVEDGLSIALPSRILRGRDIRTREFYEILTAALGSIALPVVVRTEIEGRSAASAAHWRRAYQQAADPAERIRGMGLRVPISVAVTTTDHSLLAVVRFVVRNEAQ